MEGLLIALALAFVITVGSLLPRSSGSLKRHIQSTRSEITKIANS